MFTQVRIDLRIKVLGETNGRREWGQSGDESMIIVWFVVLVVALVIAEEKTVEGKHCHNFHYYVCFLKESKDQRKNSNGGLLNSNCNHEASEEVVKELLQSHTNTLADLNLLII